MLFAHSQTNLSSWRMVFSRSVSELSSQTIRIRAPSGIFNGEPDSVMFSAILSRVCVKRIIVNLLHFHVPNLGPGILCNAIGLENDGNVLGIHVTLLQALPRLG